MIEKKRMMKKWFDEKCINRVNIFDSINVNVVIYSKNIYMYLFIIFMLYNFVYWLFIIYYCDF